MNQVEACNLFYCWFGIAESPESFSRYFNDLFRLTRWLSMFTCLLARLFFWFGSYIDASSDEILRKWCSYGQWIFKSSSIYNYFFIRLIQKFYFSFDHFPQNPKGIDSAEQTGFKYLVARQYFPNCHHLYLFYPMRRRRHRPRHQSFRLLAMQWARDFVSWLSDEHRVDYLIPTTSSVLCAPVASAPQSRATTRLRYQLALTTTEYTPWQWSHLYSQPAAYL